jgi:hypothetical protein
MKALAVCYLKLEEYSNALFWIDKAIRCKCSIEIMILRCELLFRLEKVGICLLCFNCSGRIRYWQVRFPNPQSSRLWYLNVWYWLNQANSVLGHVHWLKRPRTQTCKEFLNFSQPALRSQKIIQQVFSISEQRFPDSALLKVKKLQFMDVSDANFTSFSSEILQNLIDQGDVNSAEFLNASHTVLNESWKIINKSYQVCHHMHSSVSSRIARILSYCSWNLPACPSISDQTSKWASHIQVTIGFDNVSSQNRKTKRRFLVC